MAARTKRSHVKHQKELEMVERVIFYSAFPALRHGAYSGMTLLPGEDPQKFREVHEAVIAEYKIDGPSEHAIAFKLAHVIWREQHLEIYGYAAQARKRYLEVLSELVPQSQPSDYDIMSGVEPDPKEVRKAEKAAEKKASEELGSAWRLVEMGDVLTLDHLNKELEIAERLSRLKERLLKQLMFARGVKSISLSSCTPASPPLISNAA
jgi:hypothetical protein